jgi:NADH dehydrogenase
MSNMMKVAVFGGTGFVGSYVVNELINFGHEPQLFVRNGPSKDLFDKNKVTLIEGVLGDSESIGAMIKDSQVIIYAIGIIRENAKADVTYEKLHFDYFKQIVDIAKQEGIKKIIYISANGVDNLSTRYQSTKYLAEQYLQENFNNWTVFRPSVVFGDPRGNMEFNTQLKHDIFDKSIPIPLFFKINPFKVKKFFRSNPVHVKDLSKLIVKDISNDKSNNKIYNVGGLKETSWYAMIKTISDVLNKRKLFVPVPISIVQIFAKLFDRYSFFPITADQLKMLKDNNTCYTEKLFKEYDIEPTDYSAESVNYLNN